MIYFCPKGYAKASYLDIFTHLCEKPGTARILGVAPSRRKAGACSCDFMFSRLKKGTTDYVLLLMFPPS